MPGMMEKGPELLGKSRSANGSAKSPAGSGGSGASSTNGGLHYSEPESGCSSDDEHDVGMRVGAEYQARIPEFDPGSLAVTGFQPALGLGESSAYGGALPEPLNPVSPPYPAETLFSIGFPKALKTLPHFLSYTCPRVITLYQES